MSLATEIDKSPSALREEWAALCAAGADTDVYLQPFFLLTLGGMCADMWAPEYVTVRDGGDLVGLLPVYRRVVKGCRIVGFPVSGSIPPLNLIAAAGREAEVAGAVSDHFAGRRDWDLLWLHQVDLSRPAGGALAEALEQRLPLTRRDAGSTFVIDTREGTAEDFMAGRPRKFRMEVERCTRRHADLGEVLDLECPGDISLDEGMALVGQVLNRSWKGDEDDSDTLDGLTRYARAAMAEGKLRLSVKMVDDHPSSYLISFLHADRIFPFHIAYDLELRKIGPGQVQLRQEVGRAFDGDTIEIDLGGGFSYLRNWSTGERFFTELRVIRPAIRSKLLANAYLKNRDRRHAEARAQVEKRKQDKKESARAKQDGSS